MQNEVRPPFRRSQISTVINGWLGPELGEGNADDAVSSKEFLLFLAYNRGASSN